MFYMLDILLAVELTKRADVTCSPELNGDSSLRTNGLLWVWLRV